MKTFSIPSLAALPLALFFAAFTTGCPSTDNPGPDSGIDAPVDGGSTLPDSNVDVDVPEGWHLLGGINWDQSTRVGLGSNYCRAQLVTDDLYIKGFRAIAPQGTTRITVTVFDWLQAVNDYECDPNDTGGFTSEGLAYAWGIGSGDVTFPDGVGIHLKKGQKILINVETALGATKLSGTSAVLVQLGAAADVSREAKVFLVGAERAYLPPGISTSQTNCSLRENWHLVGLLPIMNQYGTRIRFSMTQSNFTTTLYDRTWNVNDQPFHAFSPEVNVAAGGLVSVFCNFNNTSGAIVAHPDEMCRAAVYAYSDTVETVTTAVECLK